MNQILQTRIPTLYPTHKEVFRVMDVAIEILKGDTLKKDSEGFISIDELCLLLKSKDSSLGYLNRNHIVEFFFKDTERKVLISGIDRIKYKEVKYVQPPEILYFGTVTNFISKMRESGIRSNTKGYVKLYDTPEKACAFAQKFARVGERTASIAIDASRAFSDGLKFSTFQDGEFIVVQVNKKYIK